MRSTVGSAPRSPAEPAFAALPPLRSPQLLSTRGGTVTWPFLLPASNASTPRHSYCKFKPPNISSFITTHLTSLGQPPAQASQSSRQHRTCLRDLARALHGLLPRHQPCALNLLLLIISIAKFERRPQAWPGSGAQKAFARKRTNAARLAGPAPRYRGRKLGFAAVRALAGDFCWRWWRGKAPAGLRPASLPPFGHQPCSSLSHSGTLRELLPALNEH